jgi:hypothetical protein
MYLRGFDLEKIMESDEATDSPHWSIVSKLVLQYHPTTCEMSQFVEHTSVSIRRKQFVDKGHA